MLETFEHTLNVIVPVLLCAGVGFLLAVFKAPFDNKLLGSLVRQVGYPTLILSHLTEQHIDFMSYMTVMAASVVMVAGFGLLGLCFLLAVRLPVRAFLSPMMLSNVGNVGIPVATLAFGDKGLAVAIAFVAVTLCFIFTIGKALPMGRFDPGEIFKQPVLYAVVISLIFMANDIRLTGPVKTGLDIMGNMTIPLMLLILGHGVASLRLGQIFRPLYLTAFHIAAAVLVANAVVFLFPFEGVTRDAVIVLCFMPPAVATYLWIDEYQPKYAKDVAGFIVLSKLATIAVVPVVLTIVT